MIDKRYRDQAHEKYKNIIDKAFMYGDIMEHISVNRTKSSSTDGPSEYTIELKLEFKSSEVDISKLEDGVENILSATEPNS